MHSYLRTIGFSEIRKDEWQDILNEVIRNYDEKHIIEKENKASFVELSKSYGIDMGITVCGEYDEHGQFVMEYAFPYFRGSKVSTTEDVYVELRSEKEAYSGACEDVRFGVTLIFYLANAGSFLKDLYKDKLENEETMLSLSALSMDGKIILPIKKDIVQVEVERQRRNKRESLWKNHSGEENPEMWEEFAKQEFEEMNMIMKRVEENDILTIVDTYLIPYGMECDRYTILGEITEVIEVQNYYTNEMMYEMSISCNDMEMDVCINQKDLLGEPKVGRRFKGVVWMQGHLYCSGNMYE